MARLAFKYKDNITEAEIPPKMFEAIENLLGDTEWITLEELLPELDLPEEKKKQVMDMLHPELVRAVEVVRQGLKERRSGRK
jgi:hypothetical protein